MVSLRIHAKVIAFKTEGVTASERAEMNITCFKSLDPGPHKLVWNSLYRPCLAST